MDLMKNLISKKNLKTLSDEKFRNESYSQCGEDIIIAYIFNSMKIDRFSFLDIGAFHPYYLSNTYKFYKAGLRGMCIEPDPIQFELFKKHRSEDINLNIGISDIEGDLTFYKMSIPTLNTFSKKDAELLVRNNGHDILGKIKVPVNTIRNVLHKYLDNKFPELLSLDVEGLDKVIIESIDFEKNFPIVICVETLTYSEDGKGQKDEELINLIINNGYFVFGDTFINTIFVKAETWFEHKKL